jgi:AcrR family transcriptional regulator
MPQSRQAVRVGYPAKRARTERSLVRAAMAVMADRGPHAVSVAAVVDAAGVSQGTFYNYFPTAEALVTATTDHLARAVVTGATRLGDADATPTERVVDGARQVLALPQADPLFAHAFVAALAGRPDFRDDIRTLVRQAVAAGAHAGEFDVVDLDATTDAVFGTVLQALRSALQADRPVVPMNAVVDLLLRLLTAGRDG